MIYTPRANHLLTWRPCEDHRHKRSLVSEQSNDCDEQNNSHDERPLDSEGHWLGHRGLTLKEMNLRSNLYPTAQSRALSLRYTVREVYKARYYLHEGEG